MRNYDRKWAKPLAVVINNQSYSDAEIFPHAFRTLGLGKVVGQATGGHVIGTGGTRLIDGSTFRVPRVGVWTVQGVNMEKKGVTPDVPVDQTPEAWAKGQDTQLAEAVKVLGTDVVAWKKARAPAAVAEAPKAQPTQPVATPTRPQGPEPRPAKTGG
jgi:tricorn protease